tara:strand:- start:784 stop:1332 length:549 start_codon:yes stop_codon:yes gene_type:complete
MPESIFNTISVWATGAIYAKHDIVKNGVKIYYSLQDHTSGSSFSADSAKWGGHSPDPFGNVISNPDGSGERPHFFFKPSYGGSISSEPKVKTIFFGEGYEQRVPESINNNLINLDLTFENRKSSEAKAILHFLKERSGSEPFLYTPTEPYSSLKLFICPQWSHTSEFFDNNSITAKYREVPL